MSEATIHELTTEGEWLDAYPVMVQLRTHLDEDAYLGYLREMADHGYRLFAVLGNDTIISLAGVEIRVNMYHGRHVWVHELVTDADHRSEGHGFELLSFLSDWARQNDCERVSLSSGLQRKDAHRFYEERVGMDRVSFVYTQAVE